ncbi:PREDICTED: aquaporin AQPAe.a-like [Wasmannia auropunctata]|uniref:aquaporin AQPAe.a-like n=1 Tax=Wasmannia auropunctata TaxID=64793 RepID=UPI0005F09CA2|nr:PREDICTED: aquaporin AQPAe.a-like [Wasmannia auropunctata]
MEQNGISIISPSGVTENSARKSKSIGITFRSNSAIQSAKERLKAPWIKKKEEDSTWDKSMAVLAELIGTAILVFLGCMACLGGMKPYKAGDGPSLIHIAFAFGLAVMIAVQCVGHISGAYLNPAITFAAVILGKRSPMMAGFYIVAQCLGAMLGYGLLQIITPPRLTHDGDSNTAATFCTNNINSNLSGAQGLVAEAFATGIFAFFACASWDTRNAKNTDSLGLKFGLCVSMLCLAFIPHTGCSLNPARTLGPAVWNNFWEHHWLYWVGPIGGAIIAATIYRCFFLKSQETTTQDNGTLNGIET